MTILSLSVFFLIPPPSHINTVCSISDDKKLLNEELNRITSLPNPHAATPATKPKKTDKKRKAARSTDDAVSQKKSVSTLFPFFFFKSSQYFNLCKVFYLFIFSNFDILFIYFFYKLLHSICLK